MTFGYRTALVEDFVELYACMRPADRAEVQAARGRVLWTDLWKATWNAPETTAVRVPREGLVCIYGVVPGPAAGEGVVWLLGTDLLDRYGKTLCRQTKATIARWHQTFPVLRNATDKRNRRVIRWLRWLGFQFTDEVSLNGAPFIHFQKAAPCVIQSA